MSLFNKPRCPHLNTMTTPQDHYPTTAEQALNESELAAYDHNRDYTEAIDPILGQLSAGKSPAEIAGYLGSGSDKHAFRADTPSGPVVVKVIRPELVRHYPSKT